MAIGFIPTTDRDGLVDMRSQDTSMSGLSQNTEAALHQVIASDARTLSSGIAACSDLDHAVVQELAKPFAQRVSWRTQNHLQENRFDAKYS